uniref:Uncharacterized protein n=1 Tax=Rhizophora mucronata TaxID=61149 RepID=A0A2P2Q7C3_RHIMU
MHLLSVSTCTHKCEEFWLQKSYRIRHILLNSYWKLISYCHES